MTDILAIREAAARLAPVAMRTPMLESPFLNAIAGRRVLVKAECLQRTGSFKFRGAWNAVSALPDAAKAKGVLAYSSGNHAQGIACAAAMQGVAATIVMPADAPKLKLDNTRFYGATIVTYDRAGGENREAIGEALAAEKGLTLIRPYDEPAVIAGQGTVGLEIARQARAMGVTQGDVIACCGGGGLSAGIALALEEEAPGLTLRTAEPAGFDDMARSLAAGERLSNPSQTGSICDAIVTPTPGEMTFPILLGRAGPGLVVTDDEALAAMAHALLRLKIVVEPGGAVALAAALRAGAESGIGGPDGTGPVVAVTTGGNADPARLAQALAAAPG